MVAVWMGRQREVSPLRPCLRHRASGIVSAHGEARGWHQFTAGRHRRWTITGAVEDAGAGRLLLGVLRDDVPLAQYLPIDVRQARAMGADLLAATMADDGSAEFLMVGGTPFDIDEVHCLLGVLTALLGAIEEGGE